MSRRAAPTQAEITRSVKALQLAGYACVQVVHDATNGKITVCPGMPSNDDSVSDSEELTELIQQNQEKES